MPVSEELIAERRELRNSLQDIVDRQEDAGQIPLALAHGLHTAEVSDDVKRAGLAFIKNWVGYTHDIFVPSGDPYAIRYHVSQFAAQEIGEQRSYEELQEVSLGSNGINRDRYAELISTHASDDILSDPDVAIVGGAARLALKMYAGVDVQSELPINDIDAVISSKTSSIAAKAVQYGIDLGGTKIVDTDVRSSLDRVATNFDCTMNQVAVHQDKLLFSESALQDIKEGNIRLIGKNDPLFGSEGVQLDDGHVYINRVGFYRGLSFLLRGKGDRLIVSEENIEREKHAIGRYWQIILLVKLLPMSDEISRYVAIGQWHEVARRIGATETANANEFLSELTEAYPSTNAAKKGRVFDAHAQARWLVGRLVNEAVKGLYPKEEFSPPDTYTEANLTLSDSFADYSYAGLLAQAGALR